MSEVWKFQIQPNPTSGQTMLSWEANGGDHIRIRLMNTIGQVSKQFELPAEEDKLLISTNQLPAGIYWVTLETEGVYLTQKLIIQ